MAADSVKEVKNATRTPGAGNHRSGDWHDAMARGPRKSHRTYACPEAFHPSPGPAPSSVTVNTNDAKAIINWQGFSIGGARPQGVYAALRRIGGAEPGHFDTSLIDPRVTAVQRSGISINPNGIVWRGAIVDVAGLVASSLNLANDDFISGRLRFTETPRRRASDDQRIDSFWAGDRTRNCH